MSIDDVEIAMMNLLWPRRGLARGAFYDYWSGAHTQISSRLPGVHQYFQHHLDPDGGRAFPGWIDLPGTGAAHPGFYGDAEITFASSEALAGFAAALSPLMNDEQNVFDKTISYQARRANIRTAFDHEGDDSPNGDLGRSEKYLVYLRRSTAVPLEDFRARVRDELLDLFAGSGTVLKARCRLVDAYDNDAVTLSAPDVDNHEPPGTQIDGALEVVFEDAFARRLWGASSWARNAVDLLRTIARDVIPCRVLRTFTVYNHGRITLAGLRTPQMATQIRALGAVNQVDDEVSDLMLGKHVQARV